MHEALIFGQSETHIQLVLHIEEFRYETFIFFHFILQIIIFPYDWLLRVLQLKKINT